VDGGGDVFFALDEAAAKTLAPIEPGLAVRFVLADTPDGPLASQLERGFAPEPIG
jgi:cold shock CspA family protein